MPPPATAARPPRAARLLERLGALHAQLYARSVYRATATYAVACAGLIQLTDVLAHNLHFPDRTVFYMVLGSIAGLPVTIATPWGFEVRRGRRGPPPEPPAAPEPTAAYVNNLPPQPTPFVGRERELA